jgi:hypothetical protein
VPVTPAGRTITAYGSRDCAICDPAGNLIRSSQL